MKKLIIVVVTIMLLGLVGVVVYGKITGKDVVRFTTDKVVLEHETEVETKMFAFGLPAEDGTIKNYIVDYNHIYQAEEDGTIIEVTVTKEGGLE